MQIFIGPVVQEQTTQTTAKVSFHSFGFNYHSQGTYSPQTIAQISQNPDQPLPYPAQHNHPSTAEFVVPPAKSSVVLPSERPFTMISNNSGPRTDPCGVHLWSTTRLPETAPFKATTWHLQSRYEERICRTSPPIPYLRIFCGGVCN